MPPNCRRWWPGLDHHRLKWELLELRQRFGFANMVGQSTAITRASSSSARWRDTTAPVRSWGIGLGKNSSPTPSTTHSPAGTGPHSGAGPRPPSGRTPGSVAWRRAAPHPRGARKPPRRFEQANSAPYFGEISETEPTSSVNLRFCKKMPRTHWRVKTYPLGYRESLPPTRT